MLEQDVVDNNERLIDGLDHVVNSYINMDLDLPDGGKQLYGKVIGLCLDKNGRMIGTHHINPSENTVL